MSVDQFLLSADTTDLNYPEIRPTLDLNFARVKALDPRIDFTRASGGSYVGADGLIKYAGVNEARFDHDPVTGESLGFLVETSRTNLLIWSEDFNTWGKSNVTVQQNVAISPDGSRTADKIIETASGASNTKFFNTFPTVAANTNYTFSIFLKAEELKYIIVYYGQPSSPFTRIGIRVNLLDGSFTNADVGTPTSVTTKRVDYFGNGWYRVQIGGIFDTTTTLAYLELRFQDKTGTTVSYQGDGITGVYAWGAQLEAGRFATSYIPTQASGRTRFSDFAEITGKNFSDFYNPRQDEGTIFTNAKTFAILAGGSDAVFVGDINTNPIGQAYIDIIRYQPTLRSVMNISNTVSTSVIVSNLSSGKNYKSVHAFKPRNSILVVDGSIIGINNSVSAIPSGLNSLEIGKHKNGFYLNGTINRLTYWPKRLPNEQLQALTR
jgi:hypothetical protein